ncbi:Transcriptional regulator, MarR family [Rhodovulum sp. P5]|uniref:MarR family winged helix-turn-helix transcriptional regulator n=1 Tax=Rhodovulum sp. P5 TaxID=1564506 RepID=UPI0009C370DE|nr:MarR family transcriptional regulator [Rhodovulum sp. P5]ARE41207.1 Transcriptional regulator, MarR family [Rhodovulum sp. P5]
MLHDAARLLKADFERRARGYGLTLLQWRVLRQLAFSETGLRQTEIARRVESSPMTVSDVLDRLEGFGLVQREVDPDDSRAKRARITAKAEALLHEVKGIVAEAYDQALAGIDPAEREVLERCLQQIVANLETTDEDGKEDER